MMKKIAVFILATILIFLVSVPALAAPQGTAITSYEGLKAMSGSTASFYLARDITVPDSAADFSPIENFNGTFDGNGKKISGLKVKAKAVSTVAYSGLFATIGGSGTVKNLTLEYVTAECSDMSGVNYIYIGTIAGKNQGSIINCRVSGRVSVNAPDATVYAGGIVGYNEKKILCLENYTDVDVKAAAVYAGGITGDHRSTNHSVDQCINNGDIIVAGDKSDSFGGGIVGKSNYRIINCANYGTVSVFSDIDSHSGGIVGALTGGNVTRSYNAGKIRCNSTREMYWDAIVAKTESNAISCFFLSESVQGKKDSEIKTATAVSADKAAEKASFKTLDFDVTWKIEGGKLTLQNITAAIPKVPASTDDDHQGTSSTPQGTTSNPQGTTSGSTPEDGYTPPANGDEVNSGVNSTTGSSGGATVSDNAGNTVGDDFAANKALPIWIFVIIAVLAVAGVCVFLYRYSKK